MTAEELIEELMKDRFKLVESNFEILKIVIYEINFHEEVREVFFEEFTHNFQGIGIDLARVLGKKLSADHLDEFLILRTLMGQIIGVIFQLQMFGPGETKTREQAAYDMMKSSSQVVINGLRGMVS